MFKFQYPRRKPQPPVDRKKVVHNSRGISESEYYPLGVDLTTPSYSYYESSSSPSDYGSSDSCSSSSSSDSSSSSSSDCGGGGSSD